MSAIRKLHDYLAKSPSVVYPEDVLTYLPAIEAENAKLRNEVDNLLDFEHLTSVAVAYAGCDECGEYKQTMLRLFAENAKLRQQLADVTVSMSRVEERCAKLRELAARAWLLFTEHGAVHPCDLSEVDAVRDGLREMGVEVDK